MIAVRHWSSQRPTDDLCWKGRHVSFLIDDLPQCQLGEPLHLASVHAISLLFSSRVHALYESRLHCNQSMSCLPNLNEDAAGAHKFLQTCTLAICYPN